MVLWILKTILIPFKWIGRYLWLVLPVGVQKNIRIWFHLIVRHFTIGWEKVREFFRYILALITNKR